MIQHKRYGWIVAAFAVGLSLFGIKTVNDASERIVAGAQQRIEPLLRRTEERARKAEEQVTQSGEKIASVKKQSMTSRIWPKPSGNELSIKVAKSLAGCRTSKRCLLMPRS